MSIEERKSLAKQMILALPTGDFSSFPLAPSFWAWSAISGALEKEVFLRFVSAFGSAFPGQDVITIDTVTGEDDRVFVQFRVRGVLGNDVKYHQNNAFMVEFDSENRVRHWREYFDTRLVGDVLLPALAELDRKNAAGGSETNLGNVISQFPA